jgi:hypothetical protein
VFAAKVGYSRPTAGTCHLVHELPDPSGETSRHKGECPGSARKNANQRCRLTVEIRLAEGVEGNRHEEETFDEEEPHGDWDDLL